MPSSAPSSKRCRSRTLRAPAESVRCACSWRASFAMLGNGASASHPFHTIIRRACEPGRREAESVRRLPPLRKWPWVCRASTWVPGNVRCVLRLRFLKLGFPGLAACGFARADAAAKGAASPTRRSATPCSSVQVLPKGCRVRAVFADGGCGHTSLRQNLVRAEAPEGSCRSAPNPQAVEFGQNVTWKGETMTNEAPSVTIGEAGGVRKRDADAVRCDCRVCRGR